MNSTAEVDSVATILAQGLMDVAHDNGMFVAILAAFGALGILNAGLKQASPVFHVLFYLFIITPAIVVMSLYDKEYGRVVTDEIKAISGYIRGNPQATKQLTRYAIGFAVLFISLGAWTYLQAYSAGLM